MFKKSVGLSLAVMALLGQVDAEKLKNEWREEHEFEIIENWMQLNPERMLGWAHDRSRIRSMRFLERKLVPYFLDDENVKWKDRVQVKYNI